MKVYIHIWQVRVVKTAKFSRADINIEIENDVCHIFLASFTAAHLSQYFCYPKFYLRRIHVINIMMTMTFKNIYKYISVILIKRINIFKQYIYSLSSAYSKYKISKMDIESDNSWGLNSSFNITSLDPIMYIEIVSIKKYKSVHN